MKSVFISKKNAAFRVDMAFAMSLIRKDSLRPILWLLVHFSQKSQHIGDK